MKRWNKVISFFMLFAILCAGVFSTANLTSVFAKDENPEMIEIRSLGVGERIKLNKKIGFKEAAWESSNPSVAYVTKKGTVTAVKVGSAIIKATETDGTETNFKVDIKKAPDKITIDKTSLSIYENRSDALKIYLPEGSAGKVTFSSEKPSVAAVNGKGVVSGVTPGETTIHAVTYNGYRVSCKVTVKPEKWIAITFDDGPSDQTNKLLDYFEKAGGKATFFMVGERISMYPDIVKRMYQNGHELGNHSYSHKNLKEISYDEVSQELQKTNQAIKNVTGANPTVFRPPYGAYHDTILKQAGMPLITWNVDTLDWKYEDAAYVKKYILDHASEGAIVLLHDLFATSADGAIEAMKALRKEGYRFVTVTELLSKNGKKPVAGTVYNKGV